MGSYSSRVPSFNDFLSQNARLYNGRSYKTTDGTVRAAMGVVFGSPLQELASLGLIRKFVDIHDFQDRKRFR